jgi:hypothetical protein
LRPHLTTGLPFSLAHTRMRLPAETYPVLAMNAPYTGSQSYAIPLGEIVHREVGFPARDGHSRVGTICPQKGGPHSAGTSAALSTGAQE